MAYFNGSSPHAEHYVPVTKVYCDTCAETELPLKPKGTIGRHWDTGFRWAPWYGGGRKCDKCGKET